ncbi:glycolate oxidase subunit GlcE [Enterovibrio coralii]|uniref:glycolate oxidase subunit GlcE n=1 Tax=Enterovibrio coralii TaxID=294935 RepID=UPI000ADE04AC|nr:glycolate oxidase subunit GlcE [Enterovibrio coralii]
MGGNSKAFYGREPIGEPVSLSAHQGIISYKPSELVISARTGTRISELQAALVKNNQMLVGEPPAFNGKATLGGAVASGLSGASRPYSGSLRDAILGVKLINGLGEHLRFGGQVMKNVAGYDVSRLQAGAFGAFGILTEVTLRVRPIPVQTMTMRLEMSQVDAIKTMRELAANGSPVSGSAWYQGYLYVRLSGASQSVTRCRNALGGTELDNQDLFWRSIRNFRHPFFKTRDNLFRLSIAPSSPIIELAKDTFIDWGGAARWVHSQASLTEMARIAELHGGHAMRFRSEDNHNECFHPKSDAEKAIHISLKHAFDPQNLFNRGRMYYWLGAEV